MFSLALEGQDVKWFKDLQPELEHQIWLCLLAVTFGEFSYLCALTFSSVYWNSSYNLLYGVAVNTN